jgi:D-3-phosphoglycerate dehydrogenase
MVSKKVLAPGLVPVVGKWFEQPGHAVLRELQDELKKVADVDARSPASPQEWAKAMRGVHVIAGVEDRVDEAFLKFADKLEMIQTISVGYNHIDVQACTRKGVIVCNVPEVYSEPVAQHVWALILDLTKHITKADKSMRDGTWETKDWMGVQLWGKTLGIVGLGSIGGRVAMKGRLAFGMRVLAYDPYIRPERAQLFGAELTSLENLLKESDVISINVLLTPETRHSISEKQLSMMKRSALLVNTSRGPVIDEKALVKCLANKGIRGAGLDVFETEPLPKDSPLLKMENVVLTPHIASSTSEAVEDCYRAAVANVVRHLKGQRPLWIINPDARPRTP